MKVEMNSLKGVLEILNPQNKHILLDNDLADLLEIKRRRSRRTINNLMSRTTRYKGSESKLYLYL